MAIQKLKTIPSMKNMYEHLSKFIQGQEEAKRTLILAIYKHYLKKLYKSTIENDQGKFEASSAQNVLIMGPTGCGKTYMVTQLARYLGVPIITASATEYSETGYKGKEVDEIFECLVDSCGGDLELAHDGIIFLDEIDKISAIHGDSADAGSIGVQKCLLTWVGGNENITAKTHYRIDSSKLLFIAAGAFTGIENVIKERFHANSSSMGFGGTLKEKNINVFNEEKSELLPQDLHKYGLMPELVGRFSNLCILNELTVDDLVTILISKKGSPIKESRELFELHGIELTVTDAALRGIAEQSIKQKAGARGLYRTIQKLLANVEWKLDTFKEEGIREVIINEDVVAGKISPVLISREKGAPNIASPIAVMRERMQELAKSVTPCISGKSGSDEDQKPDLSLQSLGDSREISEPIKMDSRWKDVKEEGNSPVAPEGSESLEELEKLLRYDQADKSAQKWWDDYKITPGEYAAELLAKKLASEENCLQDWYNSIVGFKCNPGIPNYFPELNVDGEPMGESLKDLEAAISYNAASKAAQKWWDEFKRVNNSREDSLIWIARELVNRKATLSDFIDACDESHSTGGVTAVFLLLDYKGYLSNQESREFRWKFSYDLAKAEKEIQYHQASEPAKNYWKECKDKVFQNNNEINYLAAALAVKGATVQDWYDVSKISGRRDTRTMLNLIDDHLARNTINDMEEAISYSTASHDAQAWWDELKEINKDLEDGVISVVNELIDRKATLQDFFATLDRDYSDNSILSAFRMFDYSQCLSEQQFKEFRQRVRDPLEKNEEAIQCHLASKSAKNCWRECKCITFKKNDEIKYLAAALAIKGATIQDWYEVWQISEGRDPFSLLTLIDDRLARSSEEWEDFKRVYATKVSGDGEASEGIRDVSSTRITLSSGFQTSHKHNQIYCSHCATGRYVHDDDPFFQSFKLVKPLTEFVNLTTCPECGDYCLTCSNPIKGRSGFTEQITVDKAVACEQWASKLLQPTPEQLKVLSTIKAVDGISNTDLIGVPCKCILHSGEELDFCSFVFPSYPWHIIKDEVNWIGIDEVKEILPSEYALSAKVRYDLVNAVEIGMNYAPGFAKTPNDEIVEFCGSDKFFLSQNLKGSQLTAIDTATCDPYSKKNKKFKGEYGYYKITYVIAHWNKDYYDLVIGANFG